MTAGRTFSSTFRRVERAGLPGLRDGQKVSYDVETDPRKGKPAAVNLKLA